MRAKLKAAAAILGLLALLGGGLALYILRSEGLRESLRARIVQELERATGAKAEMRRFDFDWLEWRVWVEGLALHGLESPEQKPYVSIPRAELRLSIRSWISRDVELSALRIERPEVHIYVGPDGKTNIPSLPRPSKQDPVESLLKLKIQQLSILDGVFEYDSVQVPLRIEARDFQADLNWQSLPAYKTKLKIGSLTLPVLEQATLEAEALLRPGAVDFERLRLTRGGSWLEARGQMQGISNPEFDLDFRSGLRPEVLPSSPLKKGSAELQGRIQITKQAGWKVDGQLAAKDLGYASPDFRINGVALRSRFLADAGGLRLDDLRVTTLGAGLDGSAALSDWRDFRIQGQLRDLELDRAWAVASKSTLPWSGILNGPIEVQGRLAGSGVSGLIAKGDLQVEPEPDQLPVNGRIAASWSQSKGRVDLDTSHLSINESRVTFRGALGDRLEASLLTSSLSDFEPLVELLTSEKDFDLPLDLAQGQARIEVNVTGPLDDPSLQGTAHFSNLVYRGITIDRLDSGLQISEGGITLRGLTAARNQTRLNGEIQLPLQQWKLSPSSPMEMKLSLQNADAEEIQRLVGVDPVFQMKFGGLLEASGSLEAPNAVLKFTGSGLQVAGETFDKASADLTLRSNGDSRLMGSLQIGPARTSVDAVYRHAKGDWENGSGTIKLSEKGFELSSLKSVTDWRAGLKGGLAVDGSANFSLRAGRPRLDKIGAVARVEDLALDGQPLGSLRVEANTIGEAIGLSNTLVLEGRRITGSSLVQLDRDYNAEGVIRIPRLPFALIRRVAVSKSPGEGVEPLPVQGFLEGEVVWKAPLAEPSRGSAQVTISRMQLRPRAGTLPETELDSGELVVRNNGPVTLALDAKALTVRTARFQALNTDLNLSGRYLIGARAPWEFVLRGTADLAILSNFQPGIVASGTATIDGGLRGAADDPLFSGKMQLRNASFYLKDFPNGIETAEGSITFERNRASIDKLTGRTGGGQFEVRGFLGLNQGEATYRLQAKADNVRVRYPEGVSTLLDADLALTGSSTRSLLAGTITVERTGFNPRSDFASVVGSAGSPIPAPVGQNEFLRNLLFDIRIRTAANATIQSSYTQDLSAEADLRLRGSPAKPVLLGSVKASQGDVNFFGNRYTVSRGEILFYNVATIQPAVDLNLETRIRGVTVFISVTGPLSKLNVNYRSEPPLQSADIFALLTVGRAPTAAGTTLPSATDPNRAAIPGGSGNSLLGVALSTAVSSRVEKFFGKSRIKIDPQMTGVENIPQARLTIEQSISRDVTLTLVTNLARAQQQLVRLEWDLSREWQLIVVRDENGVFGADFAYRKRFK